MQDIFLLTDYQHRFGSKHDDFPYRSGMDKDLLKKYFAYHGFEARYMTFSEINFRKINLSGKYVIYTSSNDIGYHYKSYIEDILYGLSLKGARLIPHYNLLRANNNKVFMEILRDQLLNTGVNLIKSSYYGTLEDLKRNIDNIKFPVVIKSASGANGKLVELAKNRKELIKNAKKLSRTKYLFYEIWDFGRSLKHKGYVRESKYRNKFIVQNFIPGLMNDWKIYIFGDKYYIFYRPIFEKRVFKASGGGYDNYSYDRNAKFPNGIFDYAEEIFNTLNVPHLSLDIAYDQSFFYLLEFQAVYFGTAGILYSDKYFYKKKNKWISENNEKDIEKVYAESISYYIKQRLEKRYSRTSLTQIIH